MGQFGPALFACKAPYQSTILRVTAESLFMGAMSRNMKEPTQMKNHSGAKIATRHLLVKKINVFSFVRILLTLRNIKEPTQMKNNSGEKIATRHLLVKKIYLLH